jgi:uncharacterized repeat protein (TIGR01451 family)
MSKRHAFSIHLPGFILACGVGLAPSHSQEITTVAGGGPVGTRPALSVGFQPAGVVFSGANTFIAASRRVFVLDSSGNLTVVAGNGGVGSSGDGGPAISAATNATRLALDGAGNIYFSDFDGHRVRRVDASTGIVTTVAGNGVPGYSGDGGPAVAARLFFPLGVALDAAGNLFIADSKNNRVRRIDAATGTITTVAGTGISGSGGNGGPATSATLSSPLAVAVDAGENIFISEGANVRRIDAATGIISRYAGLTNFGFGGDGGPATAAQLNFPNGLAIDGFGNLFIADTSNQRIRRVDAATGTITTVAGNGTQAFSGDGGPAVEAGLSVPADVAVNAVGEFVITDGSNRIRRVDASTGIISSVAGNGSAGFDGDGRPATEASLSFPWGTAVDSLGNLYVADYGNNRVRKIDSNTGLVTTVAGDGTFGFGGDGGPAASAQLAAPIALAVGGAGDVFIADQNNHRIRMVDAATGTITTVAGGGSLPPLGAPATGALLFAPQGIAIDAAGNLFIADPDMGRVLRVDAATAVIDSFAGIGGSGFDGDGGPATSAFLNAPTEVALDPAGDVFIADRNNHRIRRVDAGTGIITTIAGNGVAGFSGDGGPATSASLNFPNGVAADPFGNVYIADPNAQRIRRVAADGIITTIAGTGVYGFRGDGGPALFAELGAPPKVRVEPSGNLLLSDVANGRIRKVTLSTDISITVDDGVGVVSAGQGVTYSIVVRNNTTVAVTGAKVTDALPPTLTAASWSCVASAGASCAAGGSGGIQDAVNLPGGGTATYALQAIVVGNAGVTNAVSVAVPGSFVDSSPANNTATDTDLPSPCLILAFDNTIVLTNAKPAEMQMGVFLSRTNDVPVSVGYQTADGTAIAGSDYWPVSGTLTFSPGMTSATIPVTVKATGPSGSVRTLLLNLTAPSGADIGDPQAVATIVRAH